jgi:hypothetical protein
MVLVARRGHVLKIFDKNDLEQGVNFDAQPLF